MCDYGSQKTVSGARVTASSEQTSVRTRKLRAPGRPTIVLKCSAISPAPEILVFICNILKCSNHFFLDSVTAKSAGKDG